ncbi:CG15479 [Drosophila busckii]|uniref:CG15479 n=1 Tax=Drosophila busckii TaxID=30019 RepID=A0A0M4E3W4_DROBS|nr:protein Mabiki [Drosophila busckii]ALC38396.1 CG15479 [Drosophila busckii]
MAFEIVAYRHKKFDVSSKRRSSEQLELQIKQELLLLPRTSTPASALQEDDDSSSWCSSTLMPPLAKRRRLNSQLGNSSSESTHSSSTHSLPASISSDALRDICKYHGNMVRRFPKKERTPKDQERRNKNTIACRMSRRVKKLEHFAIEEQYKEFSVEHLKIVEQSMRANAYLHHLRQLTKLEPTKWPAPAPVKNFSIDYLINGLKSEQC